MGFHKCEIKHSDTAECYELKIDGVFYGNYDTMLEAAKEFDALLIDEDRDKKEQDSLRAKQSLADLYQKLNSGMSIDTPVDVMTAKIIFGKAV